MAAEHPWAEKIGILLFVVLPTAVVLALACLGVWFDW